MRTHVLLTLMALAAIALPRKAVAEPPKGPERPDPAKWFEVLDKNHDGQLTPDELPPMLKEHPEFLKKADSNQDKKLGKEEFTKALGHMKEAFARHRGEGHRGPPPQASRGGPAAPEAHRRPGPPAGSDRRPMPPRESMADRGPGPQPPPGPPPGPRDRHAKPDKKDKHHKQHAHKHPRPGASERGYHQGYFQPGPWRPGLQGPPCGPWCGRNFAGRRPGSPWGHGFGFGPGYPHAGKQPGPQGRPGPRDIFARLDRNHDGQLSFEEFARGMMMFHHRMQAQQRGGRGSLPAWHPPVRGERGRPSGPPPAWDKRPAAPPQHGRHMGPSQSPGKCPFGSPPQCGPNCPGCPKCPMGPKGGPGHPPKEKTSEKKPV